MARRPLTLLAFAAALGTTACATQVIGGGDGGGGATGGSGGTHGGDGGAGGGPVAPNAVAEWAYTLPDNPEPSGSSSSGGGGVDPNTLNVRIGNYGLQCFGTPPYTCAGGTTWQITIALPPAMQVPGVYPLSDPALNGFFSETGSNGAPNDCWGGGGSFADGTIEVVSNDGSDIVVKLTGTNTGITEFSADGQYTASICGGVP